MIAHLVTTGLGPVYDGILHLLTTPEDLVPSIALALYAGLRGAEAGRRTLLLLPLAWLAGGLAGLLRPTAIPFPAAALFFILPGAFAAADLRLPPGAIAALALVLGLVQGFANGAAFAAGGPGAAGVAGVATAIFFVVALVSAFVVALKKSWMRVAVRVAGSWIAAAGLLLLGWSLRLSR